tara:strand:+ start:181 stop:627 length:447 start_codon:yes stop_codon:yes gene_type:complete
MAIIPTVKLAIKSGKKLKELLKLLKEKRKRKKSTLQVKKYKDQKIKNLGYNDTKKILKNDHSAAASGEKRVGVPSKARSIRNIDPLTEYKITRSGEGSPISSASDWREDMERSFGGLDIKGFLKKSTGGEITKGNGIAIKVKKFTGVK